MKKRTLLYIPLILLFILSMTALVEHSNRVFLMLSRTVNQSGSIRVPFELQKAKVLYVLPEAAEAGMQVGDNVTAINGRAFNDGMVLFEELGKTRVGDKVNYTIERKTDAGETVAREIGVTGLPMNQTFRQWFPDFLITVIFLLLLPVISFLLGFYVAFMRPRDPLAWILLFLLTGIGSIALEGSNAGTVTRFFQSVWREMLGVWLLLFGLYFPERLNFDRRYPFAKWLLLVPLAFNGIANLFEQTGRLFGWRAFWESIDNATAPLDKLFTILTMIAFGLFFSMLAFKSGTLANKDSRRRLRILYVGTSAALLPSLVIVIYQIISGKDAGFFELVPAWFAIFALILILLFPLTMAYVIVVERAMDVSVVIRQGLQYALARNGVKILQLILLVAVILSVIWIFRSDRFGLAEQSGFVAAGFALIPLIDYVAKNLRVWIDRKFFREAYNAEQILSELSEDVRTMVETKPLLETVSNRISESLHVPQIALLLRNGDGFKPAHALGYEISPPVELSESDKTIEKLRRNEPLTIYQDDEESWINEEIEAGEREKLQKLNSQLLLPIGAKDELSGVISLSPKRSEEPYTPNDLRLLKSVAAQTGLALENSRLTEAIAREAAQKERLNRELEIAREVQERLFPQELPPTEGLDYIGACRPALGVGGDYYDFLELPEGRFGIAIGDVSGKGIGASLMMASLQASLRGQAIHCGSDLAALMRHVNTLVYEASTSNRYATFFYAQLDLKTRRLIYVNAGHNPPYVLRAGGEVVRLEEGGAVVGMLPTMFINYNQGEIQLESGDLLVGYTDGISESMNPQEEEWGEEAMLAELKNVYDKPSEEILTHIVACADQFADGAKQHDDMTMIIVKII
ncbi:MAG TPA: SpoIIE family protein phosphatase [Pyrinomonadaceae bacterium]